MNRNSHQSQLEHGPRERAPKQPKLEHKQEKIKLQQEGDELKVAKQSEKETSLVNGDKEELTCTDGQQVNAATKWDVEKDQMKHTSIARKECNATAIHSTLSGPAPTDNHGSTMHTASGENDETTERPVLSQNVGYDMQYNVRSLCLRKEADLRQTPSRTPMQTRRRFRQFLDRIGFTAQRRPSASTSC